MMKRARQETTRICDRFSNFSVPPSFALIVPDVWPVFFRLGDNKDFYGFSCSSKWSWNLFWDNIESACLHSIDQASAFVTRCNRNKLESLWLKFDSCIQNSELSDVISPLAHLRTLELDYPATPWPSLEEATLCIRSLTSLTALSIGKPSVNLTEALFRDMIKLPNLQSLKISSPCHPTLSRLDQLTHLDLSESCCCPNNLSSLTNLTRLVLRWHGSCHRHHWQICYYSTLTNLEELQVTAKFLTSEDIVGMSSLVSLKSLVLWSWTSRPGENLTSAVQMLRESGIRVTCHDASPELAGCK